MKLNETGQFVASYTAIGAGSGVSMAGIAESIATELQPVIVILTFVLILLRVPPDAARAFTTIKNWIEEIKKK